MQRIGHKQVRELIAHGAQVAETLPAREYRTAHIVGATHLPLPSLLRDAPRLLTPQRPVIVYCRDSL